MRLRTMLILVGALLLIGPGCRECGCDGGEQEMHDQTSAPAIPPSNPVVEQKGTSLPPQSIESTSASAPTQQSEVPQPATMRQTIPEPEVTEEELNDPSFKSNLPRVSRRSLIRLRKLQENGQIHQPNVTSSGGRHAPHSDLVKK